MRPSPGVSILSLNSLKPWPSPRPAILAFDQPLGGLRQRLLRLADADRERAALGLAGFDQKFTEEM